LNKTGLVFFCFSLSLFLFVSQFEFFLVSNLEKKMFHRPWSKQQNSKWQRRRRRPPNALNTFSQSIDRDPHFKLGRKQLEFFRYGFFRNQSPSPKVNVKKRFTKFLLQTKKEQGSENSASRTLLELFFQSCDLPQQSLTPATALSLFTFQKEVTTRVCDSFDFVFDVCVRRSWCPLLETAFRKGLFPSANQCTPSFESYQTIPSLEMALLLYRYNMISEKTLAYFLVSQQQPPPSPHFRHLLHNCLFRMHCSGSLMFHLMECHFTTVIKLRSEVIETLWNHIPQSVFWPDLIQKLIRDHMWCSIAFLLERRDWKCCEFSLRLLLVAVCVHGKTSLLLRPKLCQTIHTLSTSVLRSYHSSLTLCSFPLSVLELLLPSKQLNFLEFDVHDWFLLYSKYANLRLLLVQRCPPLHAYLINPIHTFLWQDIVTHKNEILDPLFYLTLFPTTQEQKQPSFSWLENNDNSKYQKADNNVKKQSCKFLFSLLEKCLTHKHFDLFLYTSSKTETLLLVQEYTENLCQLYEIAHKQNTLDSIFAFTCNVAAKMPFPAIQRRIVQKQVQHEVRHVLEPFLIPELITILLLFVLL
jgi:hypothetical protein